jgi:hypothetical protein
VEVRKTAKMWSKTVMGRDRLGDRRERILRKTVVKVSAAFTLPRVGFMASFCEHGYELLFSINCESFDLLSNYKPSKED